MSLSTWPESKQPKPQSKMMRHCKSENANGFRSATTGDESLIEGSFKNQGHGFIGDINVSYV